MDRDRHRITEKERAPKQHGGEPGKKAERDIEAFGTGQNQRCNPIAKAANSGACPHWPGDTQAALPASRLTTTMPIQAGLNKCLPRYRIRNFALIAINPAASQNHKELARSNIDSDKEVISADFH